MTHCRVPPEPASERGTSDLFHFIGRCVRVEERQRPHTTYTWVLNYFNEQRTESAVLLSAQLQSSPSSRCQARPGARAGSEGRQSHVGSIKLFLFLPRSTGGRQLGVLRARVI
ncbi:hypothetical protein EVAR_91993_1 [Eumeta japonica]|uniref:Uncharacterized protein n=1 Tax=Eumeta variegata TaxID=151549 RepID=A0A4C1TMZ5_EUMVA|nr:hypothetical protein EVAR_91993_1 [Eumeta japonica]